MKSINRRSFLKGAALVSGVALSGAVGADEVTTSEQWSLPPLPWGYEKLDPEEVRKLGHLGYYAFECAGGVFWALVTALKQTVGYPYTTIPTPTIEEIRDYLKNKKKGAHLAQMFMQYGVGGVANYGTLCGSANGVASLLNIAIPMKDALKLIPKALRYYEKQPFPTDESNDYASSGQFYPPKLKSSKVLPQVTGDSVLCHVSVGTWCAKSGYASGSKERSERCARVTADMAAMAAKLLNSHLTGDVATAFPLTYSQETASCRTCHSKGKDYEGGQFTRGSMECGSCHSENTVHKGENRLQTAFGTDVGTWAGAAAIGTVAGIGSHAVVSNFLSKEEDSNEEE